MDVVQIPYRLKKKKITQIKIIIIIFAFVFVFAQLKLLSYYVSKEKKQKTFNNYSQNDGNTLWLHCSSSTEKEHGSKDGQSSFH